MYTSETLSAYKKLLRKMADGPKKKQYVHAIEDVATLNMKRFHEQGKFLGNFTSHGPDHSDRVLAHIIELVGMHNSAGPRPTPREFFVLGLAAYMHDLGMTVLPPRDEYDTINGNEQKWIARRRRHADAIDDVIAQEPAAFAFLRENEPILFENFLANVCKAHSNKNLVRCVESLNEFAHSDRGTKYAMLSGLLLLADELDVARERVSQNYALWDEFSEVARAHWWKHWLVERCYVEGNVVHVVHVPSTPSQDIEAFKEWTLTKIRRQIEMLHSELDPANISVFSSLEVVVHDAPIMDFSKLPPLEPAVVEEARRECLRLGIRRRAIAPIKSPSRAIDSLVEAPDDPANPSDLYAKLIAPNSAVFRGKGKNAPEESVVDTYVWVEANRELMDRLIRELADVLDKRATLPIDPEAGDPHRAHPGAQILHSRRLYSIAGEVGVGKTHFLGMMLAEFKRLHPELWQRTLLVRCEVTECESLLDVKIVIAKEVLQELVRVITPERMSLLAQGTGPSLKVPSVTDLDAYTVKELDAFIGSVGSYVDAPQTRTTLGDAAPIGLCVFFDNSDQLDLALINAIDRWSYNFGSKGGTCMMVFYRPRPFDQVTAAKPKKEDHRTYGRQDGVVLAPPLKEVLFKRVEYLFKSREITKLEPKYITDLVGGVIGRVYLHDPVEAFRNVSVNLASTPTDLLPSFAGTNIRLLLQSFDRVLRSWVMDSRLSFKAMSLRDRSIFGRDKSGWPRLLEAFMLGHRRWYSPKLSPIENIFHPPLVEEYGDYLIALHLMQMLESRGSNGPEKNEEGLVTFQALYGRAAEVGYGEARVFQIVDWLSRHEAHADGNGRLYRVSPLVTGIGPGGRRLDSLDEPYDKHIGLTLTPWGRYHVYVLVYQLRYWKHLFYDMVLPQRIVDGIQGRQMDILGRHLFDNVGHVQRFLADYEEELLGSMRYAETSGIRPIMERATVEVLRQRGA